MFLIRWLKLLGVSQMLFLYYGFQNDLLILKRLWVSQDNASTSNLVIAEGGLRLCLLGVFFNIK